MSIRLKPRSRRWAVSFAWRSAVLLAAFVVISNVGFVLAQALQDPNDLLRSAIGGTQFRVNVDLFLTLRTSPIIPSFGVAILAFIVVALAHFFTIGPKDMSIQDEQDAIPWWNLFERIIHGIIAVAFVILFLSGVLITFGRYLGGGTATLWMRTLHEYAGFVFTPCLVILTLIWVRHAIPRAYDLVWFSKVGGYLGYKGSLQSDKFNAGQKVWYWIMVVAGVLLAWSGIAMFLRIGGMEDMRFYVLLHFFSAIPIMLMFLVHLYMTTLGTRGSFMSMINGRFSKTAAESFHSEAPELKQLQPAGSD